MVIAQAKRKERKKESEEFCFRGEKYTFGKSETHGATMIEPND